jgi:3-methylcrotonyl-CoA carboxylase beta subunit
MRSQVAKFNTQVLKSNADEHALEIGRQIVANLNYKKEVNVVLKPPTEPLYPPSEIGGIVGDNLRKPFDMKQVIARLVDGSEFSEFKQYYGTQLVTGFARIHGYSDLTQLSSWNSSKQRNSVL